MTPESSGRTWRKTGIMYRTSRNRTFTADKNKPSPSAVTTASPRNSGASSTSAPPGHVSYTAINTRSTGSPTRKSTNGTMTAASGSSVRGKYTFVTSLRFAARLMLDPVSAEAKYCIGSTPAIHQDLVLHVPGREVRELPEDDDVDDGREDRDEDRPCDPEERLLVAHDDVAPDERPEELAVVPELGDVEIAANVVRAGSRRAARPAMSPRCLETPIARQTRLSLSSFLPPGRS